MLTVGHGYPMIVSRRVCSRSVRATSDRPGKAALPHFNARSGLFRSEPAQTQSRCNGKGNLLMKTWQAVLISVSLILAALVHGGIYTVTPVPGSNDQAFKVNRFTGRTWSLDGKYDRQWEIHASP